MLFNPNYAAKTYNLGYVLKKKGFSEIIYFTFLMNQNSKPETY
jgi:hypothetical protein